MTSPRLARGGKGRIFIYLGVVLLLTGVIAIFHNAQQQLEDIKKNEQLCQHQQESLLAQMQVIIEYKTRLEKSLQTERASHLQSQKTLEAKIQDEKLLREKHVDEDNIRLTTLQQHYKLLKSQHEDLEEECANTNKNHLTEIGNLKRSLEEATKELQKIRSDEKYKTLDKLKNENAQLMIDRENLQKQIANKQIELDSITDKLKKEIYHLNKQLDSNCNVLHIEKPHQSSSVIPVHNQFSKITQKKLLPTIIRDFNKQVQLKTGVYQIRTSANKPIYTYDKIMNPDQFSTNKITQLPYLEVNNIKDNVSLPSQGFSTLSSYIPIAQKNVDGLVRKMPLSNRSVMDVRTPDGSDVGTAMKAPYHKKSIEDVPAGVLPIPIQTGDSQKSKQHDKPLIHSSLIADETSIEKENMAHEVIEENIEDTLHIKENIDKNNHQNLKFNDGVQNNAEEDMYDNNKPFPLINQQGPMIDKPNLKIHERQKNNQGVMLGAPDLYEDEQREIPLGEPEEDDDLDDYALDHKNDLAVRN